MSNFLAIATVTEALKQMLAATVGRDVLGANATAVRPAESGDKGVNIYLYQVSPNSSWRNEDLPTRRDDSTLAQRPRAALDLYYLLTFYGEELHLEPQRLLGSVVSTLHAQPVLTRQRIQDAIGNAESGFLNGSDLAEEIEQVTSQEGPDHAIVFSSTLVIRGTHLRGDVTCVLVGGTKVEPEEVNETQISLVLPDSLRAGVQSLQVVHQMMMGTPPETHRGVESNVAAFVLRPTIMSIGTNIDGTKKVANVNPTVGQRQRVVVLLNELTELVENTRAAYTFVSTPRDADTNEIPLMLENDVGAGTCDVKPGTYLVRVQVDGAESLLNVEGGEYVGPTVTVGVE